VGKEHVKPVVQLGIEGRDEGGWYPLSKIHIDDRTATRKAEKPVPDFSGLKEGMKLSQARAILGTNGRLRENPSPEEAFYDFDFAGKSVLLIVNPEAVVTKVMISNHGKTVEEIQAERKKKWVEWVEARSPKKHDKGKPEADAPNN
jgi:hypothetical protein